MRWMYYMLGIATGLLLSLVYEKYRDFEELIRTFDRFKEDREHDQTRNS
jgi:hypothetical protein